MLLLTLNSYNLCGTAIPRKQRLQEQLSRLLESQAVHCIEGTLRKINKLGKSNDGDFGEYYGERLFNHLVKDTARACFLRYLISARKDDKKFILQALFYEAQIRDSKNPCGQIEALLNLYAGKISAAERKMVARLLCTKEFG